MTIQNVLADRYASAAMVEIFDPINRVRLEREFWVAVLDAQIKLVSTSMRRSSMTTEP